MTPRPAFTAVASLMSLLADTSGTFALQTLNYSLAGNTTGVETTLLQKKDGSFWLALWLNGSIWDVNAIKATPLPPQNVTLAILDGHAVKNAWTFDNSGNSTPQGLSGMTLTLPITSAITLVKIK